MSEYAAHCGLTFKPKVDCDEVDVFEAETNRCISDLYARGCIPAPPPESCQVTMW